MHRRSVLKALRGMPAAGALGALGAWGPLGAGLLFGLSGCGSASPAAATGRSVSASVGSSPAGAVGPWLSADGTAPGQGALNEASVGPSVLGRIAFGSCGHQRAEQPVWQALLADRPDLMLFGGDNVYASEQPWRLNALQQAYAQQIAHPGLATLRRSVPHLAIWDDHDYGLNDGGAEWAHKAEAKQAFMDFWGVSAGDERRGRQGLYHARRFGPPGRRVQVVMLDVRWWRSAWRPTDARGTPGRERYLPTSDAGATLLGEAQWHWLQARLREPADVRLLVSGIQVVAEGHGWEHWGLMPHEQQRLLDTIAHTGASGVVLLSGDRHIGAVYRRSRGAAYPLTELTSSGLTHAWAKAAEAGPNRLGDLVRVNHYALVDIDWAGRQLRLSHRDVQGRTVQQHALSIDSLSAS